jgi:hypothetical protein
MVTRTPSRATSLLALLCAVLLVATACSDDGGDEASSETTAAPAAADGATTTTAAPDEEPPSESAAASLRSELTGLLEEQVYLTGYTVQAAVAGGGLDAPIAAAAAEQSQESATELSDLFGSGYGVGPAHDFLAAWNDHREAVVGYALEGRPVEDVATARSAVLDLLAESDPEASFSALADSLEASDAALITTVDELVAETPAAAIDLRASAEQMPAAALDLANAIASQIEVEGELESPESDLRAELTGLFQESALLTGLALAETVQAGGDSGAPGPAGVLEAVAENTEALADAIEPDDSGAAQELAELWTGHIEDFEAYAAALVGDDAAGIQSSQQALVAFRDDVGDLLAERYAFTREQVAEELVVHTDSILAYTDALVREAGDLAEGVEETSEVSDTPSEAPALLREAALAMRQVARTMTGGLTAPVATE